RRLLPHRRRRPRGARRGERRRKDDAPADHRRRLAPEAGSIARTGGLGVMRQFIGSVRDDTTVQRFLVDLSPPAVREAWDAVEAAELALMETDGEPAQLAYAHALTDWGDAGGYDAEVTWDTVTVAALGVPYERCKYRE